MSQPTTVAGSLPTFRMPVPNPIHTDPDPAAPDPRNRSDRRASGNGRKPTLADRAMAGAARLASGPPAAGPRGETPTNTSATEPATPPDPKILAAATLAALGIATVAIAWGVRRATRRMLRRPTRVELRAVAEPCSRLLGRHFPAALVTEDLKDL